MVDMTREHGGLGLTKGTQEGEGDEMKVFLANSGTEANEGERVAEDSSQGWCDC